MCCATRQRALHARRDKALQGRPLDACHVGQDPPASTQPSEIAPVRPPRPMDANSVVLQDGTCGCATGYRAAGLTALATPGTITCLAETEIRVLASYSESSAKTANFYSVQTSAGGAAKAEVTGLQSRYYEHLFASAAVQCRTYRPGASPAPCHALANLCVLNMHYKKATPCQLYIDTANGAGRSKAVNSFLGWPLFLPQLYWSGGFRPITAAASLAQDMAFKRGTAAGASLRLEFYLARYTLNGAFLGIAPLHNQLAYCGSGSDRLSDEPTWLEYGFSFGAVYLCDVKALARSGEPVLYDLYVRDLAADGVETGSATQRAGSSLTAAAAQGLADLPLHLYPVPVRVVNYMDENGGSPNVNAGKADESNDVLTGRFMLIDAVSGVTTVGTLPEVVRYASKITLTVRTQAGGTSERIAPPVLTIEYRERPTAAVFSDTSSAMARDTLSFTVEYEGEYDGYTSTIIALGASLGVLVGLWTCVQVASWIRLNARSQAEAALGTGTIAMFLLLLVSAFASAFAGYLWFVCAYWMAYFKLQDSVYSLLPVHRPGTNDNSYTSFGTGLVLIFIMYCIRLGYLLWKQVTVDIFLLDWEKPRGSLFKMGQDLDGAAAANAMSSSKPGFSQTTNHRLSPVSVWRTIFAANEWAELSIVRRTNVALTLIVLVLLLEGAKLKYVATPQPDAMDLSPGPINPALQFASTFFWYAVIIVCQLAWAAIVHERYLGENPTTRFLDLCTVMKVSMLLMDHRYRGFYLHANAPHEHADGDMAEVAGHLYEEAAALRVGRGLMGCPDPSCQTFEVHVPGLWREKYDNVFRRLLDAESAAVESMAGSGSVNAGYGGSAPGYGGYTATQSGGGMGAFPGTSAPGAVGAYARSRERTRRLAAAQSALSSFLKGFVDETDPDYKRVWRERTLLQAAFDFPPDMLETMQSGPSYGMPSVGGGLSGSGFSSGGLTYMYMDHAYRFERLIFRGIEVDLAAWDGLLFCLVDYALGSNPTAAAVTTYVFSSAVAFSRRWLGQRNIAYKTLVDDRFLS